MSPVRIALVLPYGTRSDGFFPDTLAGQLAADARAAGHHAEVVRVYYDGDRGAGDRAVGAQLAAWLEQERADLVALERVFDPAPIAAWKRGGAHRRVVLIARGDSLEPTPEVDAIVGWQRGATRTGRTRRAITVWQLADAFARLVTAHARGEELALVPGVAGVVDGAITTGSPLPPEAGPRRPLTPVLAHHAIASGPAPAIVRRTVFGNAGCPYAADPRALPLYRDLTWPDELEVAQLGCAFCCMGGDYERKADAEVIDALVAQARHITTVAPTTIELVLDDQHALRYLAELITAAAAAGVPPMRWLFAARSDTFVRERARVEAAIAAAEATGASVEVYLTGFEAFSDAELTRYNKGTTVADQLAAIAAMRALTAAHPRGFHHARAKGHSLLLWNPWTAPADLARSIAVIRAHGLGELFHGLGENRLRLYPDLPIFHAAERAGALTERWDDGDGGAGRGKGYHAERPWRFIDPRTALAWRLAGVLRARLGVTTEAAQLAAIAAYADTWRGDHADVEAAAGAIATQLDGLVAQLAALARRQGGPRRGHQVRAEVVRLDGGCANACAACPNRDRPDPRSAADAIAAARATGRPIVLAGREPSHHPDLIALITAAAGDDRRPVGVVTSGRGFADPAVAAAAVAAGLTAASVKRFAPDADTADALAGAPGADAEARAGLANLATAGVAAIELRAPLAAANLIDYAAFAAIAGALPVTQVRIEGAIDAIGLAHLAAAGAAITALVAAAHAAGLAVEASTLDAGTTLAAWMPVLPSSTR
ncbi:MAG: hypothetical protein IPL61_03940 [Myxococcales bacterium]|nr:hypothetical protein [Myxococcales bacterium]